MQKVTPAAALPAALYVRISRDREGAGLGIERQETDCRALAERLGWHVTEVFADNDISAASGAPRPAYRAMLDAVRSGQVKAVLAWHTDRLHRRPVELEEFISLAENHGLQVQTVKAGNIDLSTPSGRMVARMLGSAARYEVDQTKDRIKRQKQDAAGRGQYRGGPRPFGYEPDGMTVREDEARAVLEASRAALAGRTLAALAREWNERGLTGTLGRPWTYNNLRDVLLRPRNAGLLARGLPGRKKQRPGEPDWSFENDVIGPAAWPAIVPEDEWRALVTLLADPARRMNKTRETRWLGSGIYRCGVPTGEVDHQGEPILCGAVLRTAPHGGTQQKPFQRRYLYRCSARAHLTIRADLTDAHVLDVVAQTVRDPRIASMMHPGTEGLTADRQRRAALEVRLSTIEADYIDGGINAKLYAKATEKVAAEIQEIDERMARALRRSASSDILMATDPGKAFLDAPIDVQRAVLATVLSVTINPQPRRGVAWDAGRVRCRPAGV